MIRPRFKLLAPHFSTTELVCRHCGQAPSQGALVRLADFGERLRHRLGDHPLRITSGYRCPEHNHAVGGALNSYHMKCMALDFVVTGLTVEDAWERCRDLQDEGVIGGLGHYTGWVHADFGPKRSWEGP